MIKYSFKADTYTHFSVQVFSSHKKEDREQDQVQF